MSHYTNVNLEAKGSTESLVAALIEMGWKKSDIEVHENRMPLIGYMGDTRSQHAHVIIRRDNVGKGLGRGRTASNDMGFERRDDGTWQAHISDFDNHIGFNDAWQKKLLSKWALCRVKEEATAKRWSHTVEENDQHIFVTITVP